MFEDQYPNFLGRPGATSPASIQVIPECCVRRALWASSVVIFSRRSSRPVRTPLAYALPAQRGRGNAMWRDRV